MTDTDPSTHSQSGNETFSSPGELQTPRAVEAGRGLAWWKAGFASFRAAPGAWVGAAVVMFLIMLVLALIPLLGTIVTFLLSPVFAAGFMIGCRAQDEGKPFEFNYLFAGFYSNRGQLMMIAVLYAVASIGILLLVGLLGGGAGLFTTMSGPGAEIAAEEIGISLLPTLVALLLYIPLLMAYWFAPALCALHNQTAMDSLKLSLSGCLKNIFPFLVYGLIGLGLSIVASIPFGLGWLVLMPMMAASVYAGYRDIFLG